MKGKLDSIDWIVLLIIILELLDQNWSNLTLLNYISLALSMIVLVLLAVKFIRR